MNKAPLSLVTLAVFSALSTPAAANNAEINADIERITVTDGFRQQSLQHMGGSISVASQEDIAARNAQHVEELLNGLANVNFASGASRGRYIQIRGIGLRSQFVDSINPSVAVLIDGINYSGLGGAGLLFDMQQVELFRGPQGTQFGADALAGVLHMTSREPSEMTDGRLQLGYGNYGTYSAGAAFGGALSDQLQGRVSVLQQGSDGYVENIYLDRDDTNDRDEFNGRVQLSWQASENWHVGWVGHFIDIDNGYDAFSLDFDRKTRSDQPGVDRQESRAMALTPTYSGFDGFTASLKLTAMDSDLHYGYDEDWTFDGFHDWGYVSTDDYLRDRQDYSADLRLVSDGNTLFNDTTAWVAGLYANRREVELTRLYGSTFVSNNDTSAIALYGQLNIQHDDNTRVILGARGERYDIDYSDSVGIEGSPSDWLWGLKAGVEYQYNDNTLFYTTLSRSDKAGGVNGDALSKLEGINDPTLAKQLSDNRYFEPETLYNLEFGVKGSSDDDRLVVRTTAFYNYRDNVQLKGWVTDQRDGSGETFVGYLDNAESGEGYGLEIEARYQYNPALALFANLGYLETQINDYVVFRKGQDPLDLDGREMAHAPGYQFNLGGEYSFDNGFYARLEVEGRDAFYFSDGHNAKSDSYELVNANLGYQGDLWRVSLWARNLFDKDYATRGFLFPNDPRDFYAEAHNYVQYGEPRVFGLTLDMEF